MCSQTLKELRAKSEGASRPPAPLAPAVTKPTKAHIVDEPLRAARGHRATGHGALSCRLLGPRRLPGLLPYLLRPAPVAGVACVAGGAVTALAGALVRVRTAAIVLVLGTAERRLVRVRVRVRGRVRVRVQGRGRGRL